MRERQSWFDPPERDPGHDPDGPEAAALPPTPEDGPWPDGDPAEEPEAGPTEWSDEVGAVEAGLSVADLPVEDASTAMDGLWDPAWPEDDDPAEENRTAQAARLTRPWDPYDEERAPPLAQDAVGDDDPPPAPVGPIAGYGAEPAWAGGAARDLSSLFDDDDGVEDPEAATPPAAPADAGVADPDEDDDDEPWAEAEALDDAEDPPAPAAVVPAPAAPRVVRARVAATSARLLAWAVDGTVLAVALGGVILLTGRVAGTPVRFSDPWQLGLLALLAAAMGVVYATLFTAAGGQTVGARLARIRILDAHGRDPGVRLSFLRALAAVPGVALFLVGLVWAVLDDRGQALHDRLARTYAVEAGDD